MWLLLHIPIVLLYQIHYNFPVTARTLDRSLVLYTKRKRHQCSMTRNNQNPVSFFSNEIKTETLFEKIILVSVYYYSRLCPFQSLKILIVHRFLPFAFTSKHQFISKLCTVQFTFICWWTGVHLTVILGSFVHHFAPLRTCLHY